jgi:mannobiose 2-epimerase
VQAEALLGFLNAWQKTGEEKYLDAVRHQWTFIKEHMADPREGSEWFWWTSEHGIPVEKPIVEPWKCPYHNGRMALEVMRRNPPF